ncbi:Dabb family protein [Neokomagataea tanensis]|uniref:Dabb family protein n=2 Tax=Neokomagataea TaxID=1223423 RepID=A0A4Y6VB78_9PROT|nr:MULTISPECIES: Dabb family protein [Neokomagataea]QDH25776.1 Dabb family protein [Neokomagataea tanensis]
MAFSSAIMRPVALSAISALVMFGMAQPAAAQVDPYSLPIASSGPVAVPMVQSQLPAQILAQQELAKQVGYAQFTSPSWHVGEVRRIVLIKYRADATEQQRAAVLSRFLRLAQDSRRPDGRPVVESIEASVPQMGDGFDQIFTVAFRSEGDRNFFSGAPVITDNAFTDPAHTAFVDFASPFFQHLVTMNYDVGNVVVPTREAARHTKKHDRKLR